MAEADKNMTMEEEEEDNNSSPSNPCPICLGPFVQESYLDQCFHKFCYNCILHWMKVVNSKHSSQPSSVKCPLCKRDSSSIIHGYDGHYFQRYYINEDSRSSQFFSEAHRYRLKCYYIEQQDLLSDKFNVPRYWKSRKYLQQNKWLETWVRREVQALIQEENVDIIVHHIVGVIDSFRRNDERLPRGGMGETKQEEFKGLVLEAARPFLTGRTKRFVKEVEGFLASGFTVEAYDRVYLHHLGWKVNGIIPIGFGDEEEEEQKEKEGTSSSQQEVITPLTPYLSVFDSDEIV